MSVSFTVEGAGETIEAFSRVQKGVANLKELGIWIKVRQAFYKIQKEIFAAEGPDWKELSPKYKAVKDRNYPDKTILQATGAMYKEFTGKPNDVDEGDTEMTLSFSQPAGYHMSKDARSKIPYRSSLDFTEEQQRDVTEPIRFGLKQLAGNARLRDLRG